MYISIQLRYNLFSQIIISTLWIPFETFPCVSKDHKLPFSQENTLSMSNFAFFQWNKDHSNRISFKIFQLLLGVNFKMENAYEES
jgi:hypothetical protein